jgi:hypothetical protein
MIANKHHGRKAREYHKAGKRKPTQAEIDAVEKFWSDKYNCPTFPAHLWVSYAIKLLKPSHNA